MQELAGETAKATEEIARKVVAIQADAAAAEALATPVMLVAISAEACATPETLRPISLVNEA